MKLNRDALLLQAEELKRSVEQQENLVAITREEINLIKEDRRIKYEADKFKARPIIVAGRISFYPIVRGSGCQVYLSNNGGAISNVRIFLGSQYGEGEAFCVVGNNEWGYWDCGTEKVISFSSVGKYIFRLPSMFKVVLEYKDMLSDEGRCVLVFNYNEDKGLNVAMAEEVLKIFDESVDEILVRR